MYYDNGSVNFELDQWELEECYQVMVLDDEYLSFELEQGELE
jgi:hypothetical protein